MTEDTRPRPMELDPDSKPLSLSPTAYAELVVERQIDQLGRRLELLAIEREEIGRQLQTVADQIGNLAGRRDALRKYLAHVRG